jgi:hypothetical protein
LTQLLKGKSISRYLPPKGDGWLGPLHCQRL